jgi:hypothetical protein
MDAKLRRRAGCSVKAGLPALPRFIFGYSSSVTPECGGVSEKQISGYTVAYGQDETQFPIYVVAIAAVVLLIAAFVHGGTILLALGIAAAGITYYNFPLLETGRPRLGANEYGIFIEGFGVIRWSAIDRIDLVPIAVRVLTLHELQIALKVPLGQALVSDWRKLPAYRLLMRLPWSMTHNNVVRVNLDPFDKEPGEIHRTLVRMWRYYRS